MKFKQIINSFSAWTVDRLTSARRATLTMLATFLIAMTAQTAWAYTLQFPTSSGGAGTETDPYQIKTVDDLKKLSQDVAQNDSHSYTNYAGKYFKVMNDINFEPTTAWNSNESQENNFTPINNGSGNYNYPFAGNFDGGGHTISGIRICNEGGSYLGLFGEISPAATVKNVILADMRITGKTECGGIVGESQGTIENCHVTSTVEIHLAQNGACNIGGIAGSCSTKKISGCTSAVTISHASNLTDIRNIGGIVGDARTLVENNFVIGATIPAALRDDSNNSYGAVGGINIGATFSNNYYTNCTVAGTANATNVGVGADISNNPIGDITENNGAVYDVLWGLSDGTDGNETNPYIIKTTAGLDLLALKVNGGIDTYKGKFFKLGADIAYDKNTPNNYTPIGKLDKGFYGSFDGQGHTISGIKINNPDADFQGVFGNLKGKVNNLVVSNCSIVGRQNIGAIAGRFIKGINESDISGTIENCSVSNVTLKGINYIGGIAGTSEKGTIIGCASAATITGTGSGGHQAMWLGGIVGATSDNSVLTNNLFTGTISDNREEYIGAIVGKNANGTLTNNVHTSTVLGGIGAEGSATGSDGAGARKALTVTLPDGVVPSGTATAYNVSGITSYVGKSGYDDDTNVNHIILYNDGTTSTYYSGAGESVIFLINYDGYQVSVTDADGNVDFTKDIKQTTTNIYYNYTFTMPAKAVTITATDVWGAASGKDGSTADKAYTITSTAGLDLLAQKVNAGTIYEGKYFKLGDNIAYDKDKENNFTPIGNNNYYFGGTFDGNGKTISGINLNNSVVDNHGIFGILYGTVKNLVVSNCSIVGSSNVGAIAGYLGTATIENCIVSNNVTLSGNHYVGGIVGASSMGTIKGCVSAAAITGTQYAGNYAHELGGIVGATTDNPSILTDNLFTGAITGVLGQYIGAIVGKNPNGGLDNNLYTSTGLGGRGIASGSEQSTTGADGAGAHKAVEIIAAEGVTITPTGTKTTYNVSGITAYTDNNFIGYDSKLYAGATTRATFSIDYTEPEGYMFEGFDAGEGVGIILNEGVYNLAVPASGNVTISAKLKNLTLTLDKIVEFETLAIDENMQSYVESGALKLSVTPKNKFWTLACGVDLLLPEGVVVYKARMNSAGTKVDLAEISDSELNGVLKANNGVLIASTPGESYEFKVSPENSVTTLSTADAKSYGNDNQLVPVLEETHFDSENYFILTDNQFVMVDVSKDTKVPVGKAVLKVPAGTAQARAFGIDGYDTTGDTTGINAALENAGEEVWYNLQGQRISKPTRKGIYILNGKKVRM